MPDSLGERLREARLKRGLSLRSVAQALGVSASLISQVEIGKTQPSVATLYALANHLGVSLDELLGIVMTGELAEWLGDPESGELATRVRAPLIVHESTRILRLLDLFRESKMHFAAIVDEHGSIEGVVTPADVLTAIAGELPEAADEEAAEAVARDDSSWLVDGGMSVDEVERLLGAGSMRSGDDYTTLAGFVLAQLGHLPATGESFRWRSLRFEVVDLDGRRIDKVLVQRLTQA